MRTMTPLVDWLDQSSASWEVWIGEYHVVSLYDSHYTVWRRFSDDPPQAHGLTRDEMDAYMRRYALMAHVGEVYATEWA